MARKAIQCRGHVLGDFAGSSHAVVACRAIGGGGELRVVGLGAFPCRGVGMAIRAIGLSFVDRRRGLGGQPKRVGQVAGLALPHQARCVGVELAGIPSLEAGGAMAGIAIGEGDTRERLVGNMVGRQAHARSVGAGVAGRAKPGHRGLRMGPVVVFERGADRIGVAGPAFHIGGRHVVGHLAQRMSAVVAAGVAVGGDREFAVVHPGRGLPSRSAVADSARGARDDMVRRLGHRRDRCDRSGHHRIVAFHATVLGLSKVVEFRVSECLGVVAVSAGLVHIVGDMDSRLDNVAVIEACTPCQVATRAIGGRAFEDALLVAALALGVHVDPREREACRQVVELTGGVRLRERAACPHQRHEEKHPAQRAQHAPRLA